MYETKKHFELYGRPHWLVEGDDDEIIEVGEE